jgi:hypothetical protein
MGLDIRIPIGLMFATFGVVLIACGLVMNPEIYSRSLGINVNLWWGLVLFIFGASMFLFGRKTVKASGLESEEGRETEKRERRLGLESED